ncbi:amino acid adenylation domain-containing protein [Rhodococcus sp. H36-A4]|uniref:amino acid adenylation domain-containing protein n=1 Tax=Rhodococcus sp. H36-A4 TaxID=3004353 RepID=UPI0022AF527A|nr:non-ribosomal peptide synthetase [Rhodococcus sp. H36-A4]MCZ4077345.1 amino acid adenylation domain-containing protein [Rhodococcus sp. H36-A4]
MNFSPETSSTIFPLSAAQRGIWFAQHLAGDVPISIAQFVEIHGSIDVPRLVDAAMTAGREFGTGYLRLVEVDDMPMQTVDPDVDDSVPTVDFRHAPDPTAAAHAWMRAEYSSPLRMTTDRLVSMAVLQVGDDLVFWYSRIHHIALDGYGAMTLLKRCAELYTDGPGASASTAEDLHAIVDADEQYRASARFATDRDYWREHLAGLPDPVSLAGRSAPAAAHPRLQRGELEPATAARLAAVAADLQSSIAPVTVAAFAAYLARATDSAEVTLSLPVSARTTASLRRSGGMVANVVPLRLRCESHTSVADIVRSAQLELTGSLRRQRYRQEDIARDLGGEVSGFGPSVNMMMFDTRIMLGSCVGRLHVLTSGMIEDLFVNVYPGIGGSSTHLDFQANPALYSADELAGHHERFLTFLDRFLADPYAPVTRLAMTEDPAVHRGVEPGPMRTLPTILTDAAALRPDAVAIAWDTGEVTYRELDDRSNRLARLLIHRGAQPETAVAVVMSRSYESILAMWAVTKTGAAFVPVDPSYPRERIDHLLTDSHAGIVVDHAFPSTDLSGYSAAKVTDADRISPVRPHNAAYVIYTSGSTGTPKGVVVTHRGFADLIADGIERLALSSTSRMTHSYSPSFDASLSELLLTFGASATAVVVPPGLFGGEEFTELLRTQRVTHIDVTPAVLGTLNPRDLPQLTDVVVGGDACPPELLSRWAGDRRMFNGYGPTEMTVTSTFSAPMEVGESVTIGTPIRGTAALVLDRWLQPVPTGGTGELYLSGAGMARGYHNRPGVTAARFVADPYSPGERLYRTGDLVRWTRTGELEYAGRRDFQVKIRGFRIELGEVDAAISAAANTDFVSTLGHTTATGATVLVSYVVPAPGSEFDSASILAALSGTLPAYMVPSTIMVLDAVPMTPVGKVDRAALPAPVFDVGTSSRPPSTPRELALAELFQQVLGVDEVGAEDSFFALGGDSIISIQLVSRAKSAGIVFTARDVFERKTVAGLASVATDVVATPVLVELPGNAIGEVPTTPIVADMIETGHFRTYSQAVLITLPTGTEDETLISAAARLLDHHDALRSRLRETHEILPPGSIDARAVYTVATGDLDRALDHAADRLDPAEGTVIQFARVENKLWIVVHHLAIDGVSWRILLPDFATTAAGCTLAKTGTSLRRWAHGLAEHAVEHLSERSRWTTVAQTHDPLLGRRALDPDMDVDSTRAETMVTVPAALTDTLLTTVPDRFGCGPSEPLLTALAMAVSAWRNRSTTVVMMEGHGREQHVVPGADLSRTLGWFTTVFPVAFDTTDIDLADAFAGGVAAGAALKAVKETLASIPDHGISYGMLRHGLGVAEIAVTPQISFNYLGRARTADDTPWMPARFSSRRDSSMPLPAAVDINAVAEQVDATTTLAVTFGYASELFDPADIDALIELWLESLAAVALHAQAEATTRHTPSDFALVSTTQQEIDAWENEFPALSEVWPLSPLQEGLLFHAVFDADGPDSYIVQSVLTLAGTVDASRLRDAAQALLDRHDNLRVAFRELDCGPRQIVLDQLDVAWTERDLRGSGTTAQDVERIVESDRATRFDMAAPPLIRFTLIRTSEDSYRLLMTNHHILLDGWSTPLLIQELLTLYAAFDGVGGLRPARSYREYLAWLAAQDRDASRHAWHSALLGVQSPTLIAPAGRLAADTAGCEHSRSLGKDVTAALHSLTRTHGITINTAIQTAWAIMLSSLTGSTDVIFGGTVSGRPPALTGVEDMLGLFINTVPVRVRLDPRESLSSLMTRVQGEQASLLDHHYVGLSEIHEVAGLPELFDTMTVFESYPVDREALASSLDLAGMRVLDAVGKDATPYPLSLLIVPGESIEITLKYLNNAIDGDLALALLKKCIHLLTLIGTEPELPVIALDAHPHAAGIHGGPGTQVRTFAEILAYAVARHPDRTALSFQGTRMTYRELDETSARLAQALIERGARPETTVALAIPRSIESIVSLWAVVHTGAAFVPIDPSLPADRIESMLADCGAHLGLTVEGVLPTLSSDVTWLDAADRYPSVHTHCNVQTPHLDNLAYLIFTSGSTGKPKAVSVSHRGLSNFVFTQIEEFRVDADSRVLHFASPSFDASISEALMAFGSGATLVIAPSTVLAGEDLFDLIANEQVSHMVITPAALATVDPMDSVRVLAVAGEAPSHEVIDRWASGRIMLNHYGPTEATIWATGSAPLQPNSPVDIGVPIHGASILVLDSWLRPVADGVAGELYLAGPGLARGYHDRPELTSTLFVPHPLHSGVRMYRTGDVVRWDGLRLHYLGRADFQVKIRGFRVELGEVDAVLTEVDGIDFAITVGAQGPSGATVLVSYVLPAEAGADLERVRRHAEERLPGYMVPTLVQIIDSIPLTPVGKIDTKSLPAPDFSGRLRRYRAPRTPLETLVVDVFTEVLGIDTIGIDDSFFDLGGNSLVATRVVSRINNAANSSVALRDLFDSPTPASLATKVDRDGGTHPRRLTLLAGSRPHEVPLSSAQQRMWFLNRFDSASTAYNMPMAIRLTGSLDIGALERAVQDVIARHEVLRTVYPQTENGPVQVVLPAGHIRSLTPVQVSHSSLEAHIVDLASHRFDVTTDVPLRVTLFTLGDNEHVIVMVLHHIAGDGWSMGPLARDVMMAYSARLIGNAPDWAPLPIQYSDYALWQHELLGDEADSNSLAHRQVQYWTEALAEVPDLLDLPTDRPRPPQQSYRGGRVPFVVDAAMHARLVELARSQGTSMFMLLHCAFAVVLAALGDTEDVTVGSPIAGRGEQSLDELIGMFVNTLVLRTHVDLAAGFDALLAQTREDDLQAFAHADIPFERLVELLAPHRSTARHPLFQVGFSFENLGPTTFELPGLEASRVEIDAGISQFDLHLIVVESPGTGIEGWFTYASDLFDASTVESVGARLLKVLHAALDDPSVRVGDIDLLEPAEHELLSVTWNDTARAVPLLTLPQLIDHQVESTPDATAVVMAGTSEVLTFAEFDARCNQLARYLISIGAGPDTLVALAMSRSIDQIVAMAAVVKAGAGYVPLDPSHPAERIDLVLHAAQPLCVLTTSEDAFASAIEVDRLDLTDFDAAVVTDVDRLAPLRTDNIVYVMFTSGSTGRPKGVTLTHGAVVNQLRWYAEQYDVTCTDRLLVLTPATFDISVWQYWTPLVTGAAAVLHRSGPLDTAAVRETLVENQITILSTVPAVLDALVPHTTVTLPDSLHHILAIGETLPSTLAARLQAWAAVHNLYGPTEAAVSVTAHHVDSPGTGVPIGTPEWNTRIHVLDKRLRPTPPGVAGELYIAGDQLARGYLGRPDITSDHFVADPFGPAGSRLYRTGDLAFWGRDGELRHLGRSDFQVKVRGFRIELGDIESALTAVPGVRRAVVVADPVGQDRRLVAYVVADESAPADLPAQLARTLPSYMIPSTVVRLDELPTNVNGKIDRTKLPAPTTERSSFSPPATATEIVVAQMYAAVLDPSEPIGAQDDFFALGGNSLLATRVADALRTELSVDVAVAWMFSAPTVEALARCIDDAESRSTTDPFDTVLPLQTGADETPLFCIHPASGLAWCYAGLAASLESGRTVYGIQSPELTGTRTAPTSLDEVAQLYTEEIRSVRPHGPYNLLGWSFGGFVAHAVAARLRQSGEEVSLLAMLDPDMESCALATPEPMSAIGFFDEFAPVLGIDGSHADISVEQAAQLVRDTLGTDAVQGEHIERLANSYNNALGLLAGYRPPVFDGDIVFFSARTEDTDDGRSHGAASSWAPYVSGKIFSHDVDSIHDRMMEPTALQTILRVLNEHLSSFAYATAS